MLSLAHTFIPPGWNLPGDFQYGSRVLLHLLAPRTPRYFPADVLQDMQPLVVKAADVAADVTADMAADVAGALEWIRLWGGGIEGMNVGRKQGALLSSNGVTAVQSMW